MLQKRKEEKGLTGPSSTNTAFSFSSFCFCFLVFLLLFRLLMWSERNSTNLSPWVNNVNSLPSSFRTTPNSLPSRHYMCRLFDVNAGTWTTRFSPFSLSLFPFPSFTCWRHFTHRYAFCFFTSHSQTRFSFFLLTLCAPFFVCVSLNLFEPNVLWNGDLLWLLQLDTQLRTHTHTHVRV